MHWLKHEDIHMIEQVQSNAVQGHATDDVNRFAASIYEVMREAVKVDKARNNVASHLMDIARETNDRALFDKSAKTAEAIWRNKTKGLSLPKAFVQARSDIRRFMANGIDFFKTEIVNEEVTKVPRTYSEMGKAYRLDKTKSDKETLGQIELERREKAPGAVQLEGMVRLIQTAPGMQDGFQAECAALLRGAFETWREEHPIPEKAEGEQDNAEADDDVIQLQAVA